MYSIVSTTDRTLLMTSTGPAVASGASMVPPSRANSIKAIGQIPQVSNGYLEHSVGKGSCVVSYSVDARRGGALCRYYGIDSGRG